MGESVPSHDGLVALNLHACYRGEQAAGRYEALAINIGSALVKIFTSSHGHDDFLEAAVASAFTNTVDRAFDLSCTLSYSFQAVGNRHAEIIVTVDTNHGLVNVTDPVAQKTNDVSHVRRSCVADRVRNIDRGCAGGNRCFDYLAKKIVFRSGGIFGGKFYVVTVAYRSFDTRDSALDNFFRCHSKLEFAMNGTGGQEDMDTRLFCMLEGFPGTIDIGVTATGQPTDRGA